jgi:hypothetical protein
MGVIAPPYCASFVSGTMVRLMQTLQEWKIDSSNISASCHYSSLAELLELWRISITVVV